MYCHTAALPTTDDPSIEPVPVPVPEPPSLSPSLSLGRKQPRLVGHGQWQAMFVLVGGGGCAAAAAAAAAALCAGAVRQCPRKHRSHVAFPPPCVANSAGSHMSCAIIAIISN
jgi:hypothetical protein